MGVHNSGAMLHQASSPSDGEDGQIDFFGRKSGEKRFFFEKSRYLKKSRYFSARIACLPSKTGMRNIKSSVSALTGGE